MMSNVSAVKQLLSTTGRPRALYSRSSRSHRRCAFCAMKSVMPLIFCLEKKGATAERRARWLCSKGRVGVSWRD